MRESFPRLIVTDSSGGVREIEITKPEFTMGRQSDNDLVLLASRISRRHARILKTDQGYLLEDTRSRHGTYVNGALVTCCPLKSGDQINLGVAETYSLTFLLQQAELPGLLEELDKPTESPAPQLRHLNLLLQMAQTLYRSPRLETVLTALVDSALSITGADRGLLFLCGADGNLYLRIARAQEGITLDPPPEDYSQAVVRRVAETGREEMVLEEASTGLATNETITIQGSVRGVVAVPLQKSLVTDARGESIAGLATERLGVLYLDSRSGATSLTGLDRQVLDTLAVEGATVIENARLIQLTREQERVQHDLELARNIQQDLLPKELPASSYFGVHAFTVPSSSVGGDYYDALALSQDRYGFVVADVSGKGLPAAILSANLQGAFAAVASADLELSETFSRVNDFLRQRSGAGMYATMFYGVISPNGDFNFVNAGHSYPLVVRSDGRVEPLEKSNFPLGLFPRISFEAGCAHLNAGDIVLLFSDGLTEAQNFRDELFGESRLNCVAGECAKLPAAAASEKVLQSVRNFVGPAPPSDDLTLVVLRFGAV
ncbi:MAG TPA: SpoIIE family protein phosphatase [Terriglobia bacterium]|nr:SpoIIE family protein phosphatase [Terriglobia bacterium]